MPTGVLTHIQAHQKQPEGGCAAQAIQQGAIGNHAHTALMQRLVTQLQGFKQVVVVVQNGRRSRHGIGQGGLRPTACGAQAFA